jgi:nucleoside-diphosphate-sugar epimerase
MPVVVIRPFNTYGPRQSARAVIPTIISQIAAGCRQIKLGDTETTRDFTFVRDTCRGLIALGEMMGGVGEVFHIGSNFEISIGAIFHEIAGIMKSDAQIEFDSERKRPENSEVLRLWCDNRKLRQATGFTPDVPLQDGLRATIEWFQNPDNLRRYKVAAYNV